MRCLNQLESQELDKSLMSEEFGFTIDQLMELAGLSVAEAINDHFPRDKYPKALVCCGPGNNGGDGIVAARHLKCFGYSPTILSPTMKPNYNHLRSQAKAFGVPVITDLDESKDYDLLVDAIFGFGFKGEPRSPYKEIIDFMRESSSPVVSVDVPSGWPIDDKPDPSAINPALLISLSAPVP